MRCVAWLTIVCLNAVFVACVAAETDPNLPEASSADASRAARDEEKLVIQSLSRHITLEFADLPLDEAIQKLSKLIDREFLIDLEKLSDEGISSDQNVSLKLGEMTAWQTLDFLLKPLQLTWVAHDGVLEITTHTHAEELLVTRVYDVRNLAKLLEPLTKEMIARQRRAKPEQGGGGNGGGGFFSVPSVAISTGAVGQFGGGFGSRRVDATPVAPKPVEAWLAHVISECLSLKWQDKDGEGGTVQFGRGCLIVSQTYRGQFEIAGFLDALEHLVEGKVAGKSIAARRIGYPAEEDAAIFETLSKPRTVEIQDEALEQVLSQMAREAGIRLWIDRAALSDEGISTDIIISPRRRMQKLPLGICLKKILEPFQLVYVVDEGTLVVTTQARANEMTTIRLYDISRISRIANENSGTGVLSVLSRSTHGKWEQQDGEGGNAVLVSPKHLAVRQTQQVHSEIALLIDDLTSDELVASVDPVLELRVYTAPDFNTARDLLQVLPRMLEKEWAQRGSINQAGKSLLVNQSSAAHDRLDEIMVALDESEKRRNPNSTSPAAIHCPTRRPDASHVSLRKRR